MNERDLLKTTLKEIVDKFGTERLREFSDPIRRKIVKGAAYLTLDEDVFYQVQDEILTESVFDPIHNTRSEHIFGPDEQMLPAIREKILKILNDWLKEMDISYEIQSVRMVGSMTGFQFNNTSDVDINVILKLDNSKDIWKLRKMLPNGTLIDGTNHPIAFWVGEPHEPAATETKRFENIYDLLEDKWLKKTDKSNIKVPYAYVMELARFFMDGLDLALSETERDGSEVEIYMSYDSTKQDLSEKEKREFISRKVMELKADIDRLKMGRHVLRSFMVEGYEDMPFKVSINYQNEDPRLSMNSMVYKAIERLGYHSTKLPTAIKTASRIIEKAEAYLATEVNNG